MGEMKAAIYTRVSTQEQTEGTSIDVQVDACRNFCKSQDWKIFKVYKDEGVSGSNLNRAGMKELLKDANAQKFDILVSHKIDRISRNLRELLDIISQFEDSGINYRSVTEPMDTSSPSGKLLFQMLGSFAEFEREIIKERLMSGKRARSKQGKWVGGSRPLGYNIQNQILVINEKETETVREIFNLASKGYTLSKIRQILNNKGLPLSSGKTTGWGTTSLRKLLENPVYTGKMRYKGEVSENKPFPSIISDEQFNQVQEILKKNRRVRFRGENTTYILSGLMECGFCNRPFFGRRVKQKNRGFYYFYTCQGKERRVCNQRWWKREPCESKVFDAINKKLKEYKVYAAPDLSEPLFTPKITPDGEQYGEFEMPAFLIKDDIVKDLMEGKIYPGNIFFYKIILNIDKLKKQVRYLKKTLRAVKTKLSRVSNLMVDGAIDTELFMDKMKELKRKEMELSNVIFHMEHYIEEWEEVKVPKKVKWRFRLRNIEQFLENATEPKLALRKLIDRIEIDLDRNVEVYVKDSLLKHGYVK